jgi:hypothetical protein
MARVRRVLLKGCLSSVLSLVLSTCMLVGTLWLDKPLLKSPAILVLSVAGVLLGVLTNASLTIAEFWVLEGKQEDRQAGEPAQAWV